MGKVGRRGNLLTFIEADASSDFPARKIWVRLDSSSAMSAGATSRVAHTVRVTFSNATIPERVEEVASGTAREISYLCRGVLFTISLCAAGGVVASMGGLLYAQDQASQ